MIRSLARWKFIDRTWGPADFDSLTEFWFSLYNKALRSRSSASSGQHTTELRFSGFPRSKSAAIAQELSLRLAGMGADYNVTSLDPDTLVATSKPTELVVPPSPSLGIAALNGAPFDGLIIEIRFTVSEAGAAEPLPGLVGATLVVVGTLHDGTVLVRAVWNDYAFEEHVGAWNTAKPLEDRVLAAFDRHRSGETISQRFASELFTHPRVIWFEAAFSRFTGWFDVPLGRPRFGGLLLRGLALTAFLAVCVTWVILAAEWKEPIVGVMALLLSILWFVLVYDFVSLESYRLFTTHMQTREWYDSCFRRSARYGIAPNEGMPWHNDPAAHKWTAELLEAGFIHAADGASIPIESANTVHRIFLAPDGVTYLVLAFTVAGGSGSARWPVWPASFITLCQTFTADHRIETTNYESPLDTLKREIPNATHLILPPTTEPLDLYQVHVKAVKELATECGISCLRHEPMDKYIARQKDISKEERQIYRSRPYSFRDHLRWYLQLDAKPPAESN